ncbi:MAG: hypothetical protein QGG67_15045 [Gammaproteobacteria bacterium]|jgi:hypothetical protein|nr:hypothetical protein [Gammaproteobacteria bacterium]MDP7456033.1 hypothetical protein [Gammaproteobacteria bacterium]HJO11769.1 hypothetical protein [Gammaproteobacteria bacterium]|tara:strand:+ start:1476 stop:1664 length:189 start_codon:yes stop_codon:yes gene_type:complete
MYRLVFLLTALLTACDEVTQVSESTYGAFEASIEVLDDETLAVAWCLLEGRMGVNLKYSITN